MEKTLFKISDDTAKKLKEYFASADFQTSMKSLKDSGDDNGTFRMVISTNQIDRHGEVIVQDGWITDNYMKNAVVLWGHDHYAIPVGITDTLAIETSGDTKSLVATGRFAGHEFAQTLRKLYDAGMLKASSVGFIPLEYNGNQITKAELLEWSFVSIPANPFALDARGFDIEMLKAKGIIKDMQEGDEVNTDEEEKKDDENVDDTDTGEDVDTEKNDDEANDEDVNDDEESADDISVDETEKTLTVTLVNGEKHLFKLSKTFDTKSGRVLSKDNRSKISNAISALEEVLKADTSEEDEVKQDAPADTKAQDVQEAEDFLKLRKGVQSVFSDLQNILTEAKADAIKKGINVR